MELARISATLPGGREIVLRELTGDDELRVARESGLVEGAERGILHTRGLILRSIESLDGEPFDASLYTAETVRDAFSSGQWRCVVELFDRLNATEERDLDAFRASISLRV